MAYGIKFKTTYKDLLNRDTEIQFLKDGYVGTPIIMEGTAQPLKLSFQGERFETVVGTAAELELMSVTDRQFLELYTTNPKEWMIKVYKNNNLFYLGYLETEMYSEVFRYATKYEVKIVANDGIGMLDRLDFLDDNSNPYTGINSIWNVIQIIVKKMGLPYSKINIIADLKESGTYPAVSENFLQYLVVNYANFYDEDGKPMSCREVLETMLKPFGLTFISNMDELYIIDRERLALTSPAKQVWNIFSDFSFNFFQNTIQLNLVDWKDLYKLDADFTIQAGYNNHNIDINRYIKPLYEPTDFDSEFEPETYTFIENFDGHSILPTNRVSDTGYNYLRTLSSFDNYTIIDNTAAKFSGIKPRKDSDGLDIINTDVTDYDNFIRVINPYPASASPLGLNSNDYESTSSINKKAFKYSSPVPFFGSSTKAKMRLKFNAKILSKGFASVGSFATLQYKDCADAGESFGYFHYLTHILLKDGNGNIKMFLKMVGDDGNWNELTVPAKSPKYQWVNYTGQTDDQMLCRMVISNWSSENKLKTQNILNEYADISWDIPLSYNTAGWIDIIFWNRYYHYILYNGALASATYFNQTIDSFCFKDLTTTFVSILTGEEIERNDEELEYKISNTNQYKTESISTELKNYDYDDRYPNDAGGIMRTTSTSIDLIYTTSGWELNGTLYETLADLLGNKYMRNYGTSTITLSGTIRGNNVQFGTTGDLFKFSKLVMTTDSIFPSKVWIITEFDYNDMDSEITFKAEEIIWQF